MTENAQNGILYKKSVLSVFVSFLAKIDSFFNYKKQKSLLYCYRHNAEPSFCRARLRTPFGVIPIFRLKNA